MTPSENISEDTLISLQLRVLDRHGRPTEDGAFTVMSVSEARKVGALDFLLTETENFAKMREGA